MGGAGDDEAIEVSRVILACLPGQVATEILSSILI